MKKTSERIFSVLLAVIIMIGMFSIVPFAADTDIETRALQDSVMQGENITVQVYFPSNYNKIASLKMSLTYDAAKLEVVSVKKGDGFIDASDEQVNGDVFSESHKTAGTVNWAFAGTNNYNLRGIFSEIVFKVKKSSVHGECKLGLTVMSASNSGYVDMTSSVGVQGCSFNITRDTQNDITFELNSSKTGYIVSDYLCASYDSVTIPSEHNGLPVLEIGSSAFYNHAEIKSIVLPSAIEKIGFQSFYNCSRLETLIIPDTVTVIEDRAFMNCSGIKSIEMSVALESLGENAFYGCSFLNSIELPFTLKTIEGYAFENCYSLTSVKISKNTTSIGRKAFYNCSSALTFITVEGNSVLPEYISKNDLETPVTIVKDLSLGTINDIGDKQYTGSTVTPEMTVSLTNNETVALNTDYKVVYVNNINKGTAKVYVIGINGYGEGYYSEFKIICKHSKVDKTLGKAATCLEDGYYNCVCTVCSEKFTEVIPATGHVSGKWVYDKLPTIYKTGIKHMVCDECSDIYEKDTVANKIYPDVNDDKKVNSSDALAILQYSTGIETVLNSEEKRLNGDTNGDGKVNSVDALNVLQISIGLIIIDNPYDE